MRALVLVLLAACGTDPSPIVESHLLFDGFDETNLDCRTGPCEHRRGHAARDRAGVPESHRSTAPGNSS